MIIKKAIKRRRNTLNVTLGSEVEIPPHAIHMNNAESRRLTKMKIKVADAKLRGLFS